MLAIHYNLIFAFPTMVILGPRFKSHYRLFTPGYIDGISYVFMNT